MPATLTGHTRCVNTVAFTPDGHMVVSTSVDHTVRVWDFATGTLVAFYALDSYAASIAVAFDNRIVVGTNSGQLHFLTLRNCP